MVDESSVLKVDESSVFDDRRARVHAPEFFDLPGHEMEIRRRIAVFRG